MIDPALDSSPQSTLPPLASLQQQQHQHPQHPYGYPRQKNGSIESFGSGASGSSNGLSDVPKLGHVRCYWAMLTPHCPLEECEWDEPFQQQQQHPSAPPSNGRYGGKKTFELEFVNLGPVLSQHMKKEADLMLGRGLMDFIHPEERERECWLLKKWLGGSLEYLHTQRPGETCILP